MSSKKARTSPALQPSRRLGSSLSHWRDRRSAFAFGASELGTLGRRACNSTLDLQPDSALQRLTMDAFRPASLSPITESMRMGPSAPFSSFSAEGREGKERRAVAPRSTSDRQEQATACRALPCSLFATGRDPQRPTGKCPEPKSPRRVFFSPSPASCSLPHRSPQQPWYPLLLALLLPLA